MKKWIALLILLIPALAYPQGVRIDNIAIQGGNPLRSIPNAVVTICTSAGTGTPCTPLATTYTDVTLATPCPGGAQLVLANTSTCAATADTLGNYGAWVAPGTYILTVTAIGLPPYSTTLTLQSSLSGTPNIIPVGSASYPATAAGINAADSTGLGSSSGSILVTAPGSYCDTTVLLSNGHTLNFGAGTYQVNIAGADSNAANVTWAVEGLGTNQTVLQACPASGLDVITDQNFGTLTGTGNLFGVYYPVIKGLTIDGNGTAPYGIRLYGQVNFPQDATTQNTVTGALWFEQNGMFKSGRPLFDVMAFGADPTGATCSTTAVQAAETAAETIGGIVFFPQGTFKANITMTTGGVSLVGVNPRKSWPHAGLAPSRLVTCVAGTAPVVTITAGVGKPNAYEIKNLYIGGNEAGANDVGVYINSANTPAVTLVDVTVEGFAQQCIYQAGPGGQLILSWVLTLNCLFARTSAVNRGAVEIHGANFQTEAAEINVGETGALVNAGLTNCALLLDGGSAYIDGVTAEFGEVGFCMTSNFINSTIVNSQSNFSLGHGWRCVGCNNNTFSSVLSSYDSQAAANTYDGFNFSSSSYSNQITGASTQVYGASPVVRYCFNDQTTGTPGNFWENDFCTLGSYGTGAWYNNTSGSTAVHWPFWWKYYATGILTPDVTEATGITLGQSTPGTITNFTGGIHGQQITLIGSHFVTLANNANIVPASGAALQLEDNKIYRLTNFAGVWYQDGTERDLALHSLTAKGTAAGLTGTGACATITTQHGGAWAGDAKCTGGTAGSTLTITPGTTAPTGWVCYVQDETTRANLFQQTSHTQTTCVLTATSVTTNDVFVFSAVAY